MARIYIHGKKVNELPHKQNPEGSDQLLVQDEQSNYSTLDELKNYIVDGYATEESVTQEVNTAIANLVGTAPESLDTLQELAEALNNDDDFAATVTNKLGEHDTAISNLQTADTQLGNRITALEQSESTNDYTELENKPQINSVTLEGNKTLNDLGIQAAGDYALKSEIPDTSELIKDINSAPQVIKQFVIDLSQTKQEIDYAEELFTIVSSDNSYAITTDGSGALHLSRVDDNQMRIYLSNVQGGSVIYILGSLTSSGSIIYSTVKGYALNNTENGIAIQSIDYSDALYPRIGIDLVNGGNGTKYLADDGQYHTIDIPETQNAVMLTLTTDLANGNGTITADILNKITTARTNKQPIYVINDRPAYPVVELAVSTDGKNEQSQGTVDLIMPTRIDADGKATQVVYQIVGSASTTLTISTVTREVSTDTTGLVKSDTITNIKVVTELPAEQEQNVLYIVTGEGA